MVLKPARVSKKKDIQKNHQTVMWVYITITNHPFGNGFYQLSMVIWWMVYCCYTHNTHDSSWFHVSISVVFFLICSLFFCCSWRQLRYIYIYIYCNGLAGRRPFASWLESFSPNKCPVPLIEMKQWLWQHRVLIKLIIGGINQQSYINNNRTCVQINQY